MDKYFSKPITQKKILYKDHLITSKEKVQRCNIVNKHQLLWTALKNEKSAQLLATLVQSLWEINLMEAESVIVLKCLLTNLCKSNINHSCQLEITNKLRLAHEWDSRTILWRTNNLWKVIKLWDKNSRHKRVQAKDAKFQFCQVFTRLMAKSKKCKKYSILFLNKRLMRKWNMVYMMAWSVLLQQRFSSQTTRCTNSKKQLFKSFLYSK